MNTLDKLDNGKFGSLTDLIPHGLPSITNRFKSSRSIFNEFTKNGRKPYCEKLSEKDKELINIIMKAYKSNHKTLFKALAESTYFLITDNSIEYNSNKKLFRDLIKLNTNIAIDICDIIKNTTQDEELIENIEELFCIYLGEGNVGGNNDINKYTITTVPTLGYSKGESGGSGYGEDLFISIRDNNELFLGRIYSKSNPRYGKRDFAKNPIKTGLVGIADEIRRIEERNLLEDRNEFPV